MTEPDVVLHARGLSRNYQLGGATIPVLSCVDLRLLRGESVSIVGASGSGKTTLIQVLGLLDGPETGSLQLVGEDALAAPARRRNEMRNATLGFVFQFYHLVGELTALENVLLPARIGGWHGGKANCVARARDLLDRVGLTPRIKHHPAQLSGGERQRVAIARALINEPAILLCDEPTGNLDPRTSGGVQDLLLTLTDVSRALLVVTHEETFARRCDRVLRLKDGALVPDDEPAPGGEPVPDGEPAPADERDDRPGSDVARAAE